MKMFDINLVLTIANSITIFILLIIIINIYFNTKSQRDEELNTSRLIHNLETNIIKDARDNYEKIIKEDNDNFEKILKQNVENYKEMSYGLKNSLDELRKMNEEKLSELRFSNEDKLKSIESNINEKLDVSLNKRLDNSFKVVGEQLQNLNVTIGQLQSLSSGVSDLQKTLSNVKTRGVFGERQLESILENMMIRSQYEVQFKIKPDENDRVDFAIKIPDKTGNGFIYLPIDAKFPNDTYIKLIDVSKSGDEFAINQAVNELKRAIELEAMSINKKYINVPITTDFAVMFLPTEGLYAEVLRIPGLAEKLQNQYKILVTGPTTIAALINSLSVGFKYLQVNEFAADINKILQAIKAQFDKFSVEIDETKDKLLAAEKWTDKLSKRNEMITKKLKDISKLDENESNRILGIEGGALNE